MIDVVVKMTPDELAAVLKISYRMGRYNQLIHMNDGMLTELGPDGGGTIGMVYEENDDIGMALAAMYTAFSRSLGEYPRDVKITAERKEV